MAALTTSLANSLINATLRSVSYTSPGAVYVACYSTSPTNTGSGTEVTGGSYTRMAVTFAAPTNGTTSNTNEVDIIGMPAITVVGLAIMDASSGGNMLYFGNLQTAKTTNAGDTFTIKVGDLSIALA